MLLRAIIIGLFLLSYFPGITQGVPSKVTNLMEQERYWEAIDVLNAMPSIRDNEKALHARALCSYLVSEYQQTLVDIARAKNLGNKQNELNYYLAKAYHRQGRYKKAINWYKEYLAGKPYKRIKEEEVVRSINQCFYALNTKKDIEVLLEQLPSPANSKYRESNVLRSPLFPSTIYLTRKEGKGSAVKSYSINKGNWEDRDQVLSQISQESSPIVNDISGDGQIIFFEAALKKKQLILYQKSGDKKNVYRANMPYFPDLGDRDLCIIDKKTIIFSSLRPGGFGAYDLYFSSYQDDKWSLPQNLGANINSPYDELSPFVTEDSSLLFFSSNRKESQGGLDIFYSERTNNQWNKAGNLGLSVNSPADDHGFRLEADGISSSFISNRAGTNGMEDIYFAYFKQPWATSVQPLESLAFIQYEIPKEVNRDEEKPTTEVSENQSPKSVEEPSTTKEEEEPKKEVVVEEPKVSAPSVEKTEKASTEIANTDNQTSTQSEEKAPKEPQEKSDEKTTKNITPSKEVASESKREQRKKKKAEKEALKELTADLLVVEPLFYKDEKQMMTLENKRKLEKLIRLLTIFPESKVELTNNIQAGPLKEFELYFGIIWMDDIIEYLVSRNIKKDRIIANTLGASFPYVKPNMGGNETQSLTDKNQRVDILMYDIPEQHILSYEGFKDVQSVHEDRRYGLYRVVKDDVHYRVKFASSPRIYKNSILRQNDDIMVSKDLVSNTLIYSLGFYESYDEALKLKKTLEAKTTNEIEIQVFKGSIQQSKSQIKQLSESNSDLKQFLAKES